MSDDWHNQAACRGMDPDAMQPEVASAEEVAEAIAVCGFCPVRAQCAELAEAQPDAYGVWGGRWWGDPPKAVAVPCEWCGKEVDLSNQGRGGRPRMYCGQVCKNSASRARRSASSKLGAA